ncbi:MAG: HAD family hydrolase [Oscillospiraceae bacterium]|nr:HAD family hydrolase [Oscillospiraceae bacterium]
MRPAEFLDKYDKIIFDMDGVITSEQNYWDIAALSAYELLNDKLYYGSGSVGADAQERRKEIRAELFADDRFITAVKDKGVNSNWDLCYLAFCYMVSGKFSGPAEMTEHVEKSSLLAFDLYAEAAEMTAETLHMNVSETGRGKRLWLLCRQRFQEWYLGDKLFEDMYGEKSAGKGKPGLWQTEIPIVPLSGLRKTLTALTAAGKTLGIATGRSRFEVTAPLRSWDCEKYFDLRSSVDYDFVVRGEKNLRDSGIEAQLTKPHPYMFLKAVYGTDYDDVKIYRGEYDSSEIKKTLVVGDAGSDILAAKAMGADFLAVLTGVSGEKGRAYFEETGAEYILPNVLGMVEE